MPILDDVLAPAQAESSDLPDVEQSCRMTLRMRLLVAPEGTMPCEEFSRVGHGDIGLRVQSEPAP